MSFTHVILNIVKHFEIILPGTFCRQLLSPDALNIKKEKVKQNVTFSPRLNFLSMIFRELFQYFFVSWQTNRGGQTYRRHFKMSVWVRAPYHSASAWMQARSLWIAIFFSFSLCPLKYTVLVHSVLEVITHSGTHIQWNVVVLFTQHLSEVEWNTQRVDQRAICKIIIK